MRPNTARQRMETGATVVNGWLSADSPYAAECLSHVGYDAITVDLQHGMFGVDRAVSLLQAISAGAATPMVRCASNDAAEIGKLLDAGAYGVICPSVDDGEACAAFVAACRYPPVGMRSFGPSRGLLYGGDDYVVHADGTILTWAMVESVTALQNLEQIVATPGLDGVYVGPNDLTLSLGGRPGGPPPPDLLEALRRIAEVAHHHGLFAGAFCPTAEQAVEMVGWGYDLVTPGNDISLLREAATRRLGLIKEVGSRSTGSVAAARSSTTGY